MFRRLESMPHLLYYITIDNKKYAEESASNFYKIDKKNKKMNS